MTRPVRSIVASLGELSRRWLDKKYVYRKKAVRRLVGGSGFSENMAHAMIDGIFRELTAPKLWALLRHELRDPRVLDGFRPDPITRKHSCARGPERIVHIFSANIPNAAILSFVLGMLVKSRNIGKLSSRDAGFLDVYLESLKTADKALWRSNRLLGAGDRKALSSALRTAGLVVVFGSDKTLSEVRKKVPESTPFFGYGHRLSAGLFLKSVLKKDPASRLASAAAHDVWMADQRGCLSPVVLYVQRGGEVSAEDFAGYVALALAKLQKKDKRPPRRDISCYVAAFGQKNRALLSAAGAGRVRSWESRPSGVWAVHYDEALSVITPSAFQHISVKGFDRLSSVLSCLCPVAGRLECVALECAPRERGAVAESLSHLGASRVCRAGSMQTPPVTWHHDGMPNLGSWLRWTDLECDRMPR